MQGLKVHCNNSDFYLLICCFSIFFYNYSFHSLFLSAIPGVLVVYALAVYLFESKLLISGFKEDKAKKLL